MTTLATRLTRRLNIRCPIVSAPMAFAAGGALAAEVSDSGGLGLIGGGYGDADWLDAQFDLAAGWRVGVGFITWSLANNPSLLTQVLQRQPVAVMLSFGDPRPFAAAIRAAGALLICQCQNLAHLGEALDAKADVIVAQGAEAGGHGALRGALSFVPEAADLIAARAPETLLLAAGGIADGRGLAAALMLGADGVLVGTRFWASREALTPPRHLAAILAANGDATIRTRVVDIVRQFDWPAGFSARVQRNAFVARWHGHEDQLAHNVAVEGRRYREAVAAGDPDHAGVWFGEAAGVIDAIEPAAAIVERMIGQASALLLGKGGAGVV